MAWKTPSPQTCCVDHCWSRGSRRIGPNLDDVGCTRHAERAGDLALAKDLRLVNPTDWRYIHGVLVAERNAEIALARLDARAARQRAEKAEKAEKKEDLR